MTVSPPLGWRPARPLVGRDPGDSWLDQVALEIWVDVERSPTVVTLAGTLDDHTAVNVRSVVSQLVAEGHRDLLVDVGGLAIADESGLDALFSIQAAARRSGGTVTWSFGPDHETGATLVSPPSRRELTGSADVTSSPGR